MLETTLFEITLFQATKTADAVCPELLALFALQVALGRLPRTLNGYGVAPRRTVLGWFIVEKLELLLNHSSFRFGWLLGKG